LSRVPCQSTKKNSDSSLPDRQAQTDIDCGGIAAWVRWLQTRWGIHASLRKNSNECVPLVCSDFWLTMITRHWSGYSRSRCSFQRGFLNRVDYREIRDLTRLGLQHADGLIDVSLTGPASVDRGSVEFGGNMTPARARSEE